MTTTAVIMAGANIFGRMVLDAMRAAGCPPTLVVNESGTPRAQRLAKWLIADNVTYHPDIESVIDPGRTHLVEVSDFQGAEAQAALRICPSDYLINGGAGVFRAEILAIPRIGTLNVHPGLLPEFRGLDPVLWALDQSGPLGATLHLMSEGIDEGPILIRREFVPPLVSSVLELRLACMRHGVALLTEFLADPGRYPPHEQRTDAARYFGAFPATRYGDLEVKLRQRISDATAARA